MMSYMETQEPEGSQGDLHLTDGHPVYVSVQVRQSRELSVKQSFVNNCMCDGRVRTNIFILLLFSLQQCTN